MRISDTESNPKKISCFTFQDDNKMIESFYERDFLSTFLLSEDTEEIAVICEGSLNIIKVNDNHKF